jgi:general secretion pathway protein C
MNKDGTMKHLFKPERFYGVLLFLGTLLAVKLLWFIVEVTWLPSSGIDHIEERGGKSLYYRTRLTSPEAETPPPSKPSRPVKPVGSIKDIKLLGIYHASDMTVVTVLYKGKTKVLATGEKINGFVLEGAGSSFALFGKNGKNYQVDLLKQHSSRNGSTIRDLSSPSGEAEVSSTPKGEIVDAGDHRIVDRSLVEHYANANNMKDIMKDIGIADEKEGNALKGFRVTFVRRNTPFAKLGLRRGDIIKAINGQEINSYSAAMSVYNNINKMENLTLTIKRGKEEMELEYEIN